MDPVDANDMLAEVADDTEVTDAQLGSLVRRYRGIVRPPQVIVVHPTWWDKAMILVVLALAGLMIVTFVYTTTDRHAGLVKVIDSNRNSDRLVCDEMLQLHLYLPSECPPRVAGG